MKEAVKKLLRGGGRALPARARMALMESLCRDHDELVALGRRYGAMEVATDAAREIGMTGFIAPGRYGAFESSIHDHKILGAYARTGVWAEACNGAFQAFFAAAGGGTYIDIGANIGLTTVPVAANPRVRCLAFEPEPANFANLANNVRRNQVADRVGLHQLALFNRAGQLSFSLAGDDNLGDHRVASGAPDRGATIEVACARLDEVVDRIDRPLGVKLDAQGAEPFIIEGGRRVLDQASLLVMEFSPLLIDQLQGDLDIVFDYLGGFDRFELARGDGDEPLRAVAKADLVPRLREAHARGRADDMYYLDIHARRDAG